MAIDWMKLVNELMPCKRHSVLLFQDTIFLFLWQDFSELLVDVWDVFVVFLQKRFKEKELVIFLDKSAEFLPPI